MSRMVRLLAASVLACASVPFVGASPAHADEALIAPGNFAYFYAKGVSKPPEAPTTPPNVTGSADGVSAGNLAVAANAGTEDKVSFLYFELLAIPTDATVSKAVVTLKTVPQSPTDVSFNATPAAIQACQVDPTVGFKEEDGESLDLAPARLCPSFSAKGTAKGADYQWDITALAQKWVSTTNDGVAFTRADSGPGSNFQVVFANAATATLSLTYTAPSAVPVEQFPPVFTPPAPAPPVMGGFVPPPSGGFVPAPEIPFAPAPQVNPVPQAPSVAAPATRPIALTTSLRPTNQSWLAGLGFALVLILLSLILGDTSTPARTRSHSRLALALEAQRSTAQRPSLRPRHL